MHYHPSQIYLQLAATTTSSDALHVSILAFYQRDPLVSDLLTLTSHHLIGAQVFSTGSEISQQQSPLVSQLLTNPPYGSALADATPSWHTHIHTLQATASHLFMK